MAFPWLQEATGQPIVLQTDKSAGSTSALPVQGLGAGAVSRCRASWISVGGPCERVKREPVSASPLVRKGLFPLPSPAKHRWFPGWRPQANTRALMRIGTRPGFWAALGQQSAPSGLPVGSQFDAPRPAQPRLRRDCWDSRVDWGQPLALDRKRGEQRVPDKEKQRKHADETLHFLCTTARPSIPGRPAAGTRRRRPQAPWRPRSGPYVSRTNVSSDKRTRKPSNQNEGGRCSARPGRHLMSPTR